MEPGLFGWALNVVTSILTGERLRETRQQGRRQSDGGDKDWSDSLWKRRKESQAEELRQELEAGKGMEMDSLLKPSRRKQHSHQHLDVSPEKQILDF